MIKGSIVLANTLAGINESIENSPDSKGNQIIFPVQLSSRYFHEKAPE